MTDKKIGIQSDMLRDSLWMKLLRAVGIKPRLTLRESIHQDSLRKIFADPPYVRPAGTTNHDRALRRRHVTNRYHSWQ